MIRIQDLERVQPWDCYMVAEGEIAVCGVSLTFRIFLLHFLKLVLHEARVVVHVEGPAGKKLAVALFLLNFIPQVIEKVNFGVLQLGFYFALFPLIR